MTPLDRCTDIVFKKLGDRLSLAKCRELARKILLNGPPASATDKEFHAFLVRETEKAIAEETH